MRLVRPSMMTQSTTAWETTQGNLEPLGSSTPSPHRIWATVSRSMIHGALLLGLVGMATGCGLSEDDLAHGKKRAALAGQQSDLVAKFQGSKGCGAGSKAIDAWKADNEDELATSDAWWNGLSESKKDKVYAKYPAFSQANKDRAARLIYCGSDRGLWNPSS